MRNLVFLGCQLGRDGVEDSRGTAARVYLLEIGLVQLNNFTLHAIDGFEILAPPVRLDGLWHASHGHIYAEIAHEAPISGVSSRLSKCSKLLKHPEPAVVARPAELLVVHGMNRDPVLLRRNDNPLHVLLNGYERSGFDIVIAPVSHKVFDCLSNLRHKLHLIEHDNRLSRYERYTGLRLQSKEEQI